MGKKKEGKRTTKNDEIKSRKVFFYIVSICCPVSGSDEPSLHVRCPGREEKEETKMNNMEANTKALCDMKLDDEIEIVHKKMGRRGWTRCGLDRGLMRCTRATSCTSQVSHLTVKPIP